MGHQQEDHLLPLQELSRLAQGGRVQVFDQWNEVFQSATDRRDKVIELLPNSGQEFGDLRYNMVVYHDDPAPVHTIVGYGPSTRNPRTGEIIHADVQINGGVLDHFIFLNRIWENTLGDPTPRINSGQGTPTGGPRPAPRATFTLVPESLVFPSAENDHSFTIESHGSLDKTLLEKMIQDYGPDLQSPDQTKPLKAFAIARGELYRDQWNRFDPQQRMTHLDQAIQRYPGRSRG